jgi:hypothetical protein
VLGNKPVLFVQGSMHVQCYRSKLLWFYSNSNVMCGYCLKFCFLAIVFFILVIMTLYLFLYSSGVPCVLCPCKVNVQLTRQHFYTTQWTLYFLTFCRHIMPPSTGWLNWSRWMLRWSGERKFVVYVARFEGIWQSQLQERETWMVR